MASSRFQAASLVAALALTMASWAASAQVPQHREPAARPGTTQPGAMAAKPAGPSAFSCGTSSVTGMLNCTCKGAFDCSDLVAQYSCAGATVEHQTHTVYGNCSKRN
jgi:hypothetical protein